MNRTTHASPGIHLPPPVLFVGSFAVGWFLSRWRLFPLLPDEFRPISERGGWLMAAAGIALMLTGILYFLHARTNVMPNRPASTLVTTGPYRYSRNPMYVGLTVAYLGGVLVTNNAWCLVLLPAVLFLIRTFVIRREERYLEAEFGEVFQRYRTRVRRWL